MRLHSLPPRRCRNPRKSPRPRLLRWTAAAAGLLFLCPPAQAACSYVLTNKELPMRVEHLDPSMRVIAQANHTVHWLHPTLNWDVVFNWRDPYPVVATTQQTVSLGIEAQVQRGGGGFNGAAMHSETTGLAAWHVKHQATAEGGRFSNGQIGAIGQLGEWDLCGGQGPSAAKPTVIIDLFLTAGADSRVHVARYVYERRETGSIGGPTSPPTTRPPTIPPISPPGPGVGFAVTGQIGVVWRAQGADNGPGRPTSNEMNAAPSPSGATGRYQDFERGQIILHTSGPRSGQAFALYGAILQRYNSLGGTRSRLGFPLSSEQDVTPSPFGTAGRYNLFEGGLIIWERNGRAPGRTFVVEGAIAQLYQSMGGTGSWLGMPISDEFDYQGGRRSDFEGGIIVWTRQGGARAVPARK